MESKPRIIPKKEHRISRKLMSQNALRILYRLHSRGFIAYLVGGCVRDLLLGRTPKDFDIGTNATPGQIKRLFHNSRLIGRRFRLAHVRFQDEIIEVSTFRRTADASEIEDPEELEPGRRHVRHMKDEHGMVLADNIFGTPEEDALRRDFTINALAYNIADSSVVDFTTGLADLNARLIRCIGNPRVRFTEDPVRMVRAIRFAASHDFAIEPDTWADICLHAPIISRVSPARLWEEIQKLFLVGFSEPTFALLKRSGLLQPLFPGLFKAIEDDTGLLRTIEINLRSIDKLVQGGTSVSTALVLASLFGAMVEKSALERHQDGIPRRQAFDEASAAFLGELSSTAQIPGRVAARFGAILALKSSLSKLPPRRPNILTGRPEFLETLQYLSLAAEINMEHRNALRWWEAYTMENPAPVAPVDEASLGKRKRRRRRKAPGIRQRQTDK
ncbi:MAG: polynucleotide adenylyltransferase PcnB [Syntrophorhabdaceae bacterium]